MLIEDAIAALWRARDSGALAALCARHSIDVMVLFGSAVPLLDGLDGDTASLPHTYRSNDIDIAVRSITRRGSPLQRVNRLDLLQDMYEMIGWERIDLLVLEAGNPVVNQRALTRGRLLFEAELGLFVRAQMAAATTYMDTAHFRDLNLAVLAQ